MEAKKCEFHLFRELITHKKDFFSQLYKLVEQSNFSRKVPLIFLFSKGLGFPGIFIRFFTRSKYTHTGFIHPGSVTVTAPILIEAFPSKIAPCKNKYGQSTTWFSIPLLKHLIKPFDTSWKFTSIYDHSESVDLVKVEVALPKAILINLFYEYLAVTRRSYNFLGVIGFVIPLFISNGGYFCSEGIWEAFRFVDDSLRKIPGWKLSPDKLLDAFRLLDKEHFEIIWSGKPNQAASVLEINTLLKQHYNWYFDFCA